MDWSIVDTRHSFFSAVSDHIFFIWGVTRMSLVLFQTIVSIEMSNSGTEDASTQEKRRPVSRISLPRRVQLEASASCPWRG